VPNVVVYLDDILVTGATEVEHLAALKEVFKRFQAAGLRLWKEKCTFLAPSVTYLGHKIDAQGLHPMPEKVKAMQEAPKPHNITELKSYLGLLSYYSKFFAKPHYSPGPTLQIAVAWSTLAVEAVIRQSICRIKETASVIPGASAFRSEAGHPVGM